jgi:hypothetical protein
MQSLHVVQFRIIILLASMTSDGAVRQFSEQINNFFGCMLRENQTFSALDDFGKLTFMYDEYFLRRLYYDNGVYLIPYRMMSLNKSLRTYMLPRVAGTPN